MSRDKWSQVFSPLFLHTVSNQKLDDGKAWGQDYHTWTLTMALIGCPLLFSGLECSSESFVVHLESPKECQSRSPILVTVVTICKNSCCVS